MNLKKHAFSVMVLFQVEQFHIYIYFHKVQMASISLLKDREDLSFPPDIGVKMLVMEILAKAFVICDYIEPWLALFSFRFFLVHFMALGTYLIEFIIN